MLRLLEEAWQITKKYKFLWIFGIFTGHLLPTDASDFSSLLNKTTKDITESFLSIKNNWVLSIDRLNLYNLANVSSDALLTKPGFYSILYPLILLIALIILVIILISIISEISLVWSVNRIRRNEDVNFKLALKSSFRYFARILLFYLFVVFCFLIAIAPILYFLWNDKKEVLLTYLIITAPLYIVFLFYIAVFYSLGIREIIINDMPLIKGILNIDKIIKSNLKQVFKFLIIYLILEIGLTSLIGLALLSLLLPAVFISGLFILISLILFMILKGIGSAFVSSWITLVYLDYFRKENQNLLVESQN